MRCAKPGVRNILNHRGDRDVHTFILNLGVGKFRVRLQPIQNIPTDAPLRSIVWFRESIFDALAHLHPHCFPYRVFRRIIVVVVVTVIQLILRRVILQLLVDLLSLFVVFGFSACLDLLPLFALFGFTAYLK